MLILFRKFSLFSHILNIITIPTVTMQQVTTPPTNPAPAADIDDIMTSHRHQLSTSVANDVFNTTVLYPDHIVIE